jgi:hypothetical protein
MEVARFTHFPCPRLDHRTHFQETRYEYPVTGRYIILPFVVFLLLMLQTQQLFQLTK